MSEYNIHCPHCGTELAVEEQWSGMEVECLSCHQAFVIPPKAGTAPQPAVTPQMPNAQFQQQGMPQQMPNAQFQQQGMPQQMPNAQFQQQGMPQQGGYYGQPAYGQQPYGQPARAPMPPALQELVDGFNDLNTAGKAALIAIGAGVIALIPVLIGLGKIKNYELLGGVLAFFPIPLILTGAALKLIGGRDSRIAALVTSAVGAGLGVFAAIYLSAEEGPEPVTFLSWTTVFFPSTIAALIFSIKWDEE